eukprot:scaffold11.g4019.t1
MPSRGESLTALCDAAVVVAGGRRLPVHSAYLATASPVLCEALAGQAEGQAEGRPRDLATPFSDFSLKDVCAFLRFAYHPHEATPANLAACGSSLPALLRLAHQLQVDGLLQAVASTIGNAGADLSLEQLLGCINAADACQLDETSNAAVDELVHRMLAPGALAPADALAVSSQLGRESLVAVLNGVAHMARSRQPVLFSWSVQHFGSLRREVKSPNFSVGGAEWQLRLLPGDVLRVSARVKVL